MMARRCFRTRFIYWLSYPFPEHYLLRAQDGTARYPRLYRWRGLAFKWMLYRWLLPAADHVFVQSDQMRLDVAAEGIALEKMTAVPMGIDVDMVRAAGSSGKRRLLPAGVPCVLYLGTLDKVRRLDFLIRVFAAVRASVPGAKLFIVGGGGDPEEQHFLEREALRLDLSSAVEFLGRLPQARALDYVREADVCVSPFFPTPVLRSASPTKLIEYMAMGRPVVANDQPEQRRIIEASGAGHCVAYQEEPFAAAIVELLNDPETANRMGAAGRRYVFEHRAYPVIADIVEKRLLSVAASGT
jgi:glycosyltransferase involved in cell wall biosynthesis